MDPDHLDIYGNAEEMVKTYRQFAAQVKTGGWVIHRKGLPLPSDGRVVPYAIREASLISGKDIRIDSHRYTFTYSGLGAEWKNLWTRLPGYHNVENAVAATSVARILDLPERKFEKDLSPTPVCSAGSTTRSTRTDTSISTIMPIIRKN